MHKQNFWYTKLICIREIHCVKCLQKYVDIVQICKCRIIALWII